MPKRKFRDCFIPDKMFSRVFDISPAFLARENIRGLVVDLDNTLASYGDDAPSEAVSDWIRTMLNADVSIIVLTNNSEKRVQTFCETLPVSFVHRARKPGSRGFQRALKKLSLSPDQVAGVGDQIFTDVLGAKRSGLMAILVEPLHLKGHFFFSLRRWLESPFIRRALRRENAK